MNDQSAQDPTQQNNSYVDDYTPPAANMSDDSNSNTDSDSNSDSNMSMPKDDGMFSQSFTDDSVTPVIATDNDENQDQNQDQEVGDSMNSDTPSDEDIETQNIFYMLGVEEGDEDLKEKFLDQLQEVIWDDFLTNDVELLLTQDEFAEFKTHQSKVDAASGDAQEEAKDALVEYLEDLIPDLEDIMLEKALDLKADLFVERVNSMKQLFAQKPDELAQIAQAEQLMYEDKWKSSATILNGIKE